MLLDFFIGLAIVRLPRIPAGRQAEGCGRRARFPATPTRRHRLGRRAGASGLSPGMTQTCIEASAFGPTSSIPLTGSGSRLVKRVEAGGYGNPGGTPPYLAVSITR